MKNVATGKVSTSWKDICLNSYEAQRTRPDAPATSPYPSDCPYNSYTLGSVQGIERGWTSNVLGWQNPLRLPRGKYDVTIEVAPKFVRGLRAGPGRREGHDPGDREEGQGRRGRGPARATEPRPHSKAPTGPTTSDADALEGPVPEPEVPARLGHRHLLQRQRRCTFAATVWNGGNSPLVVDGFRSEGDDHMDAYQYFFDAEGNQTGYQQVGHFHWHAKPPTSTGTSRTSPATGCSTPDHDPGGAVDQGVVLPGQHRRRRLHRAERRLAAGEHRPVERLRRQDVAVAARGALRRLG